MDQNRELNCLDELIAKLGGPDFGMQSRGTSYLLMEHLEAARRGLMGSMAGEYRASLGYAKDSVACIADKLARAETKTILQGLIDSESARSAALRA